MVELVIWLTRNLWSPSFAVPWLHYTSLPSPLVNLQCFLHDFCKVAGKHPVWDERKHVTHFLQCLLKQRLCCSARCRAPSDPCDADGCCELLEALRHGWHQVRSTSRSIWEGGRPITASVHITFSFDCCTCRPKLFGFFSTLNFLLVSNLN